MRIRMIGLTAMGAMTLAACEPTLPDSGAGVGFGSYEEYQRQQAARDAQLSGQAMPAAPGVSVQPIGTGPTGANANANAGAVVVTGSGAPLSAAAPQSDAERLASDTAIALNSGRQPIQASPSNAPPPISNGQAGISNENNFEAVDAVRTIEDDKAHLAEIRAQYQVVQPTALPSRSGASEPNIVQFALSSSNGVGESIYRRSSLGGGQAKFQRNCAKYPSPDLAQEEFLAKGGPDRDRLGLDPDGDGFACSWDPAPFRKARG